MIIKIQVKPNSKKVPRVEKNSEYLVVFAKNRPIENKVNLEVVEILADYFKISQNKITIVRGLKSRFKVIEISND